MHALSLPHFSSELVRELSLYLKANRERLRSAYCASSCIRRVRWIEQRMG